MINQRIAGAASGLSLKKKKKAVLRLYIRQSSHLKSFVIPFLPPTTTWNRADPLTKSFSEASVSHSFILYLIALAYVAPPFACLSAIRSLVSFVSNKPVFLFLQMASSCPSAAESRVNTSTMGSYEPNQMQLQSSGSPPRSDTFSPYTIRDNTNIHDRELIPPTSRLSRLPSKQLNIVNTTGVAISASYTNSNQPHSSHDVHDFVNASASLTSSPVSRTYGHLSNPPETSVSSSSQLLTNHVINHPIRRPRTHTKVFQSSKDLAAHYGIPEVLPPAPRTLTTHHQQPAKSPIIDFHTLSSNYLSMLSRNPSDNTNMTDPVAPLPTSVSPEELTAPVIPDKDVDLAKSLPAMLGTESSLDYSISVSHHYMEHLAVPQSDVREMLTPSLMEDYSPWSPDIMNPFLSTPQDSTLDTPLFHYLDDSQMLTGPDCNGPLFPMFPEWEDVQETAAEPEAKSLLDHLDPSSLIVMTPTSPLLDSFDPSQLTSTTAPQSTSSAVAKPQASRRKVIATGVRKGVTPETLLDESAPTQTRNYVTPSATSRKEVPAVFARKRARSTAFGDEEDQLDEYVLPPNPTEKDLIEQKRRQNTVAARRSRKRKLEHLQLLETSLEKERQEKEQWRERAYMLSSILSGLNHPVPDFTANES